MVALVGCRGGLMETVDIINNFPGQTHRWLVDEGDGDCSTSTRARRQPGALSTARRRGWWRSSKRLGVDEGRGDATGLGVTQRGGGRSRAGPRRGSVEALVLYKLPLSKTRKRDKSDIVERLAEEARPLSGHGQ